MGRGIATDAEGSSQLVSGIGKTPLCSPSREWLPKSTLQNWVRWRRWGPEMAPYLSYTAAGTSQLSNIHFRHIWPLAEANGFLITERNRTCALCIDLQLNSLQCLYLGKCWSVGPERSSATILWPPNFWNLSFVSRAILFTGRASHKIILF